MKKGVRTPAKYPSVLPGRISKACLVSSACFQFVFGTFGVCVSNKFKLARINIPNTKTIADPIISCYCFTVQVRSLLCANSVSSAAKKCSLNHFRFREPCTPREKCFSSLTQFSHFSLISEKPPLSVFRACIEHFPFHSSVSRSV